MVSVRFELLSSSPKQRKQEFGCLVIIGLLACYGIAVAVSMHRAGVALKPVCDSAVVGKRFDRPGFEALARKHDVFTTYLPSRENGSEHVGTMWAEKRALLYPKLCMVALKDDVVQEVTFETYSPR